MRITLAHCHTNAEVLLWVIVRKAYKRKALATHPDRFATASAAEKSLAEEQFRKVGEIIMGLSART